MTRRLSGRSRQPEGDARRAIADILSRLPFVGPTDLRDMLAAEGIVVSRQRCGQLRDDELRKQKAKTHSPGAHNGL
jgi:hypothetical protein